MLEGALSLLHDRRWAVLPVLPDAHELLLLGVAEGLLQLFLAHLVPLVIVLLLQALGPRVLEVDALLQTLFHGGFALAGFAPLAVVAPMAVQNLLHLRAGVLVGLHCLPSSSALLLRSDLAASTNRVELTASSLLLLSLQHCLPDFVFSLLRNGFVYFNTARVRPVDNVDRRLGRPAVGDQSLERHRGGVVVRNRLHFI